MAVSQAHGGRSRRDRPVVVLRPSDRFPPIHGSATDLVPPRAPPAVPDAETVALGTILAVTVGLAAAGVAFGSVLAVAGGLAATAIVLIARDDGGSAAECPTCGRELPAGRRQCGDCAGASRPRK